MIVSCLSKTKDNINRVMKMEMKMEMQCTALVHMEKAVMAIFYILPFSTFLKSSSLLTFLALFNT